MKVSTKITYDNIEELASVGLNVEVTEPSTQSSQSRGVQVVLFYA